MRIGRTILRTGLLLLFCTFAVSSPSLAQDFAARSLGDFGNVTVMEVTGNYDGRNPGGSINAAPRQVIAREFLRLHKDEYDFLVIFSNFDFQMIDPQAKAFYLGVKNDIQGIGLPLFDSSSLFGSDGKLQGTIDMGNLSNLSTDPLDPKFEETLDILSHEQMHRWGAHLKFRDSDGNISEALLGRDQSHWSFLLDSKGSVLYGNEWQENGDGTFTSVAVRKYYSPLDLYLMGLYDKSQVPPMLLIENPEIDPSTVPETGVTINGTARYVAIDEIIAVEGERIPDSSGSQKTFKTAFILITRPATFIGDEIYGIENISGGWMIRYSALTDGEGMMEGVITPSEEIPVNPGITPPEVVARTLPFNLDDGVRWLMNKQRPDGSWLDLPQTAERDTAETVVVLRDFDFAQGNYSNGLQWLSNIFSGNMDYLARKIETLMHSGQNVGGLIDELLSRQNSDGGWGSDKNYLSNSMDTSFGLKSLALAGYQDQTVLSKAIEYLKARQNFDGGWGIDDETSSIQATANALSAFNQYRQGYPLEDRITSGLSWLLQRRNTDGGFGNSPSTVYDTAVALLILKELGGSSEAFHSGLNYIRSLQSDNGSWNGSCYQTALAVKVMWAANLDPDLAVTPEDITFYPPFVTIPPATLVINAKISNLGRTAVTQARVALYEGDPSEANRVGEQFIAFPGQSQVTVTFSVTIKDGLEHRFFIIVDPENLVQERDRSNNIASVAWGTTSGPDLSIASSNIAFSPPTLKSLPSDISIHATVWNLGKANVDQAVVSLYKDTISFENGVGEQVLAFPAQSAVPVTFIVTIPDSNEHSFYISIDPENLIAESDESNNVAAALWKISQEPDLSIESPDISIAPSSIATLPATVVISALVWNLGKTDVPPTKVALYEKAVSDANKIGEQLLAFPGLSSVTVTFTLTIADGRERVFYIVLDPENLVQEPNKSNNTAAKSLYPETTYDFEILSSDVSVSPNPVDMLQDVRISSKIRNRGTMDAYNVQVRYYIDEAGSPFDIATTTVDIPASSTITNEVTWKTNKIGRDLPIAVFTDPFNSFDEVSEVNNKAVTYLTVNPLTDPNLTISYQDLVIAPTPGREKGSVNISALIKNEGFSQASNVEVRFYRGVPGVDGVLLGSQTIPSLDTGGSSRVSINWMNIMESGERLIYVQADPDNLIKEMRDDDNSAFTTLKILSLPDLALSTYSISFTPSTPKDGDVVSIRVMVQNRGEQEASNIAVRAYEGSTIVGSQVIPIISGNSQGDTSFSYNAFGKSGAHQITVAVDPENTIPEQSEDNNQASRTFAVQNSNLWLTESYISPNGDGIKDVTQFFFRLSDPQTVTIALVNEKGDIVRSFSGGELDNSTGGIVAWDGMNDLGQVVEDGEYQIRVVNGGNEILGSLLVTVDNNRSPLIKAIGTKYLLNNNLTCMLPDLESQWFPDESGFLFRISGLSPTTPEYPTGLYTMAPDGEDILRIIPWGWTEETDPVYSYQVSSYVLSPDGNRIAFSLYKQNRNRWSDGLSQLWVVDRDGRNMTLLDSYDFSKLRAFLYELKWSPNGAYIAFRLRKVISDKNELWMINSNSTAKTLIDSDFKISSYQTFQWSPDSDRLAQYYRTCDAGGTCLSKIRLCDASGTKEDIFSVNRYYDFRQIEWVNDEKLVLVEEGGEVWLVDATEAGNHLQLADLLEGNLSIAPDGKSIAFRTSEEGQLNLYVFGLDGQVRNLRTRTGEGCYLYSGDITWSPDSQKIATQEGVYTAEGGSPCEEKEDLVIIDINSDQTASFQGFFENLQWFSDNIFLLHGLSVINSETGESILFSPPSYEAGGDLSPYEKYISYDAAVDPTSVCYGRGGSDMWAMSSLLNLTADLKIAKEKSAMILRGTAADLNFESYMLEYADEKNSEIWNPVASPSETPVMDDVFTTWVPPYEGTFYVRLTVRDKAGNVAWERRRVSWGLSSSITNLYKSLEYFSPNGDGIKDTVELHYRVLEPVHLELSIYDEKNDLKRIYSRNYTSPVDDYIAWDGRDSDGGVVPDGKYRIKIYSYEFFVYVDNTPPDVSIELKLETCLMGAWGGGGQFVACGQLIGHAFDHHMRYWIVESGEGDNPQEWDLIERGEDILVGRDGMGNPILDPIRDLSIRSYTGEEIGWLVAKKARITSEDAAGNRTSAVTDFLEEGLILDKWDGEEVEVARYAGQNGFDAKEPIPANTARPGIHTLGGVETIRLPIVEMIMQYWSRLQWHDAFAVTDPPSGGFDLRWDNSSLNLEEGYAVRIKAIDLLGQEHYSNPLYTEELFAMAECTLDGTNALYEKLRWLRVQVQSDQDTRYSNWTDFDIYDSEQDAVPEGRLTPWYSLAQLNQTMPYQIRMVGVGMSGKTYISNVVSIPPPRKCDPEGSIIPEMVADNEASDCGLISGKTTLQASLPSLSDVSSLQGLSYYIQKPEGPVLLRQFDLTKEEWGNVAIDTSNMPEGLYPVKASVTYLDTEGNSKEVWLQAETLVIERVLPTAQVTYPGNSLRLCPVRVSDPKGDWYGIPVEGVIADNTGVKRFELYYGVGESPGGWAPAPTRKDGVPLPISGPGSVSGRIGMWDVTGLKGDAFSLKLKVIDHSGNVSCAMTSFTFDTLIEIAPLTVDKPVFSPNGDHVLDELEIQYGIGEYATVDVKVFALLEKAKGTYALDSTPVRTVVTGQPHLGGIETTSWDGKDDLGTPVPDRLYGVAVFGTDSCGNTSLRWVGVEVDNTLPTTMIAYPRPADSVGNIVEVRGTANDLHLQSYILEAGQGDDPSTWVLVWQSVTPVEDDLLGKWNTFGLEGRWTLRLSAADTLGNRSSTHVAFDLDQRKTLVKNLSGMPNFFSPNNDGKLDTSRIEYELTDACDVKIEIFDSTNAVKKTYSTTTASGGAYTFIWDGKDDANLVVPDGIYAVRLSVVLSSDTSVTQTESVSVVVDSTLPFIEVKEPLANSYHRENITVMGTISDQNLVEYSVSYTGVEGTTLLDKANQTRVNYAFGFLGGLPEGNYALHLEGRDLGENTAKTDIPFTVDRTPPQVTLSIPKNGEYYGAGKSVVPVSGTIVEKNLEIYSLRFGPGENPSQWTELLSSDAIPSGSQLYSWKVGKEDGILDGLYILSLYAKDRAGQAGETKARINIDNTAPEASITSPDEGSYVRAATEIIGTAYDQNLEKYGLEISEGQCNSAHKWALIKTATASVRDGTIAQWTGLPPDGDYCLRLTATDRLGNGTEARANVKVDTHPPQAPALSANIESKSTARLTWTPSPDSDLSGYYLYRDTRKINTVPIKDVTYVDENLNEGTYVFTVTAIDVAGNESKSSNQVKLTVDLTGPDTRIRSPQEGARVNGLVDIKGAAYSTNDFKQYRVSIGQGSNPSWTLLRTSPVPISYGSLAQWDTIGLFEGNYAIKVEAEDLAGNVNTHQIVVAVDNTSPLPPLLISAIPSGPDVTLTWRANAEPDLAGYLLYRNGQLVNASGVVIGDLKPYLIAGTTYLQKAVPDGTSQYHLEAMDLAGNVSEPSNALEVEIDTHPPHAVIVEPSDRSKFQDKTLVRAESPDTDIASVQFQYKKAQNTTWSNLGGPVPQSLCVTYIDPISMGLSQGDYHLRAVATDLGGRTDPSPSPVTITYTDLDAPEAPAGLRVLTKGADIALTWTTNGEPDLNGYNIYRITEDSRAKINSTPVKQATYQDKSLSDGTYTYEVTAIDNYGNESKPSDRASANVYAPFIEQPYTPVGESTVPIHGNRSAASASVEIFDETASGTLLAGRANADEAGTFAFANLNLSLGENRITAKATDGEGNISRGSGTVVVVYNEPPSSPTGLTASVSGYDAALTWNPNKESDLSGYSLYRNGEKLNQSVAVTSGSFAASDSYYGKSPAAAFDSDQATYWLSYLSYYYETSFAWWRISLPSPELISHLEIHWDSDYDGQGNEILYAARDFEIQVWSGYAWITRAKVNRNNAKDSTFDFKPPYRTDKIRVRITDSTDPNSKKEVRILEVGILKDELITQTSYSDTSLQNGFHSYVVTAVDYYGFESLPSEETKAGVGDVTPPSIPQDFTATVSGSDITLSWSPSSETDVSGYNVYRNTPDGWLKINDDLITGPSFSETGLPNGAYAYRVTAVDWVGNESLPSGEASVDVSIAPPPPPENLRVSPMPQGATLSASWEYSAGSISGYNLYRGTASGGPYVKANTSLIVHTTHLDQGLTNSVPYYYIVVTVDRFGNESSPSNEAMGIPSDHTAPSKPEIFYPTRPGALIVLYDERINLSGSAEPGATIELFKDGISLGKKEALENDLLQTFSLDGSGYEVSLSPDAKVFAITLNEYTPDASIWLKDLATEETRQIIQQGTSPIWSPDGKKIAYLFPDPNGNDRVGIYDTLASSSTPLTDDTAVFEGNPSWSSDSGRIAFLSDRGGARDLWVKDLSTNSLTQATRSGNASYGRLSPDGKKLAYFEYMDLYVADLFTGDSTLMDQQADGYSVDWSPDGGRLAIASNQNGTYDIFVLDIETRSKTQITDSVGSSFFPTWSPDGKSLAYGRYEPDGTYSLWAASAQMPGEQRPLRLNLVTLDFLSWTRSGAVAYIDPNGLNVLYPKGYFSFDQIQLDIGENLFEATATDGDGNLSFPSEPITVELNPGLIPDLGIGMDDIFIYPSSPLPGQDAAITVLVWNKGQVEVKEIDVDIYLWDPTGSVERLKSAHISSLASGSSESIPMTWTFGTTTGTNRIIVSIDPLNRIHERDESNNSATREFFVAREEKISMTTTLDAAEYTSGQNVNVSINLTNPGVEKDVVLEVRIEDGNGETVDSSNPISMNLPYGFEKEYPFVWNTGITFAGPYRVHSILKEGTGTLADNILAFTISPDMAIDTRMVTDKTNYGPQEDVSIGIDIKNSGDNYVIPSLNIKVRILGSENQELFREDREVRNLIPGGAAASSFIWSTGAHLPGDYTAIAETYLDSRLISECSGTFRIDTSLVVTGTLTVTPSVIVLGNVGRSDYTIRNDGNIDGDGLRVRLSIVEPETQTVMNTYEESISLGMNSSRNGTFSFSTQSYSLKTYVVMFQYVYESSTKHLGSASFTVKSGIPRLSVSPQSLDFGSIHTGNTSSRTTTLSSTGSADLVLGMIVLSGASPEDFGKLNDNCSGKAVASSGKCTIDIIFSPASAGPKNAFLTIPSNVPDAATLSLPLSGTGITTLNVSIDPDGKGKVTGAGIDCPGDCTENFSVTEGFVQLTAAPIEGYRFVNWAGDIDSESNPVTVSMGRNRNVTAHFGIDAFTIDATAGPGGTVAPAGPMKVASGASQTFTITPSTGYHITDVRVDGASVGVLTTYTFDNVTSNHTIEAGFAINQYTIKGMAGPNGTITPSGPVTVDHGGSQTFTITPDEGYHVADVWVDGVSVEAVTNYLFTDITSDRTIEASFAQGAYSLELSRTGQITKYAPEDDGWIRAGIIWPIPRFMANGDTTLTDNLTGMIWAADPGGSVVATCVGGPKTWQEALDHVACLNTNSYLGHHDWRLPNVNEIESLVHSEMADNSAWLSSQGFSNAAAAYYWSSTTLALSPDQAWAVSLHQGDVAYGSKDSYNHVWPARGVTSGPGLLWRTGQTAVYAAGDDGDLREGSALPVPKFTAIADTSLIDQLTGLVWGPDGGTPSVGPCAAGPKTWQEALDYAACLNDNNYLGHNDWRLPNRKELRTLIQYGQADTTAWLNTQGFRNVNPGEYWSSSTYALSSDSAWSIEIASGDMGPRIKSMPLNVLPIRAGTMVPNQSPDPVPTGGGIYEFNTPIILGGQVSDFDGDVIVYEWLEEDQVLLSGQAETIYGGSPVDLPEQTVSLGLGSHVITLRVSDGFSPLVSRDVEVSVIDTTPPVLAPVADKTTLWPANHKMVDITIRANAKDNTGGRVSLSAVVSSNEPQNGLGDGDTSPDWTEPAIDQVNGIITLKLRAERSGTGSGRIYTITITGRDSSGNTAQARVEISVPHDKKK